MSSDHTEQQDSGQIKSARKLSLKPKAPPAEVPGYTIDGLLGSGAYGEVWVALDQKTGRRVAIKFYTRQTSLDFSLLSREVEKLVFLSADRYVVQLLDVGWDAKPPYYVMDYIQNGSLEDELKRREKLTVHEAVELIEEISIGLMHLHGKGILHCDLKPGNVLLDQDKKPRLADFGQSRLSHEQAPALGTLFFMAPEQADLKASPDARWDVYALGALLYCMLTGEPPFRDQSMIKKIESSEAIEDRLAHYRQLIDSAPTPTLHRKTPGVDRNLAEIIDQCIARNPKERFASVQSVFQALRQRELAHAKRPLMILGLLGPLLLLGVMSWFGWNAYNSAISQTDQSITRQTHESNQWIAQLAARSAAEQIDNYFRVLDDLVNDKSVQSMLARVVREDSIREMIEPLTDPNRNGDESLKLRRDRLIENPLRQQLQKPLERNLGDPSCPSAASWFFCDFTGTQIASVFSDPDPTNTIGKNYAWRTYFTGRNQAAKQLVNGESKYVVNDNIDEREHITGPTMSAIFRSQATQAWKIAFSAPVYHEGQFVGIASVTANMGSFIEFIEFKNATDQYVMLVDGRDGAYQGTVLEHPLLARFDPARDKPIPESLSSLRVSDSVLQKFDRQRVSDGGFILLPFEDPIGNVEEGKEFNRKWLASWAEVKRRYGADRDSGEKVDTGFKVIAVADQDGALQPSRQLGRQLVRKGTLAILFFLLVSAGLLYSVFRSLRKSREKVARMLGVSVDNSAGSSVGIQDVATILAQSSSTPRQD